MGGFECSTHRRFDGKRLDLIASSLHDTCAQQDYERLLSVGITTARDGVRWTVIESSPGQFDWSSFLPMLRAARKAGICVIWDLLHFGWPDHVDVFSPDFAKRLGRFAAEFIRVVTHETDDIPFIAPVNEISFLSYAGGDAGFFNPFAHGRGNEMKVQLVKGCIAAIEEIRQVCPQARIVHPDPMINISADPYKPQDRLVAEGHRQSMFMAWDMISGRLRPELGGRLEYLDIIGINYYIQNQWIHNGHVLVPSHPYYLPVRYMLREVWERYQRPLFIAETGIEGPVRPNWLRYICQEVRGAIALGVPMEGLCLYPIVDHAGWEDDRYCPNGLWGYSNENGVRPIDAGLAQELRSQQNIFLQLSNEPQRAAELVTAGGPIGSFDFLDRAATEMETTADRSREGLLQTDK